MNDTEQHVLVADTGGTNTRVALAKGTQIIPKTIKRFANAKYACVEDILAAFIAENDQSNLSAAALAVAGPVRDGSAKLTNLNWQIDEETLARATKVDRAAVLNDLAAQGYAMGHINPKMLRPIITKPAQANGVKLVIGIGTGFNIAVVHDCSLGRIVPPAEAGHAALPLRNEADLRLAQHIEKTQGFAAVEDVLSGRGLEDLYAWKTAETGATNQVSSTEIIQALEAGDPLARATLQDFIRFLAMVASDQALVHLPFGGIFLIGGMARALAPWLDPLGFEQVFQDKGRFSDMLKEFSVNVVDDDFAALNGLAHYLSDAPIR